MCVCVTLINCLRGILIKLCRDFFINHLDTLRCASVTVLYDAAVNSIDRTRHTQRCFSVVYTMHRMHKVQWLNCDILWSNDMSDVCNTVSYMRPSAYETESKKTRIRQELSERTYSARAGERVERRVQHGRERGREEEKMSNIINKWEYSKRRQW